MKLLPISPKITLMILGLLSLNPILGQQKLKIEHAIAKEKNSFYFVDFKKYPQGDASLPIGVFDSGTGGLTVLDALVNFDYFKNTTLENEKDGKLDFQNESFIYLADQANMPYGNYHSVDKDDLLKEHILKDFQFLLAKNYYADVNAKKDAHQKQQVKAIVIACNTATAYGYKDALNFLQENNLNIPVIGVINAATKGTLSFFSSGQSGTIGVFATVGTIASKGYENALREEIQRLGLNGSIEIINQGGYGLAEAVDEEADFIKSSAKDPRKEYRGPGINHETYQIDKTLLNIYNFNFKDHQMLCDSKIVDDCSILQINSAENYVRFHLVSMLENMRKSKYQQPLTALILGCTHYPYLLKEINQVIRELRDYQDRNGNYIYRHLLANEVQLVDPATYVAKELYEALYSKELLKNRDDRSTGSEFYISVPNVDNAEVKLDAEGRFTYAYKYGRVANDIQQYVKIVPFDQSNVSQETLHRFRTIIPNTYELIKNFHKENSKLKNLEVGLKILN